MPPIVLTIIGIINLATQAAPTVKAIYDEARKLIAMWFSGGVITAEQQAVLLGWADSHQQATLLGQKPPELVVEPDPVPVPPAAILVQPKP